MIIITETQIKVIDAFFQVAKEHPDRASISMQMIADQAGINKATIYKYHFNNVDDIIEKVHLLVDQNISIDFDEFVSHNPSDPLLFLAEKILPFLYSKKEWLKLLYASNIDPNWLNFLEMKYVPLVEKYLNRIGKKEVFPNFILSQILVKEFLSIISVWLSDDEPEPVALFQEKFFRALHLSPADMMTI